MRTGLERQLTLSHLLVTTLSAGILALLILAGTVVFLRTDLAARWAGNNAVFFADELMYFLEQAGAREIDPVLAQQFVDSQVPPADPPDLALMETLEMTADEYATSGEWLFVLSRSGQLLAGNYASRFPVGTDLTVNAPPGFDAGLLADARPGDFYFSRTGDIHAGQAPVRDSEGRILGWVYFQSSDDPSALLLDTVRNLGWVLLGALLVAIFVSALAGTYLARRFGRRLQGLTNASAAFAAGELDVRVPEEGEDEIARLAAQFNRMAERIALQMAELRQLAEDNARLAQEASALAALEERNRLARDLHDAIKQQLFGLNLLAGSIQPLLTTNPNAAEERLRQLSQMTATALEDMDAIIQELRPASLADEGLAQALKTFIDRWQIQTGIPVDVQVQQAREIPIVLEQALYRVCQEALSNVVRHAQASSVTVRLQYESQNVMLLVQDDGCGFDMAVRPRADAFGLRSMQERIEELGGEWIVRSAPGAGTTVQVRLPASETVGTRHGT